MTRALLADYAGVMTFSLRDGMAHACRKFGAEPARFAEILRAAPGNPMVEVERGRLDWAGFSKVFGEALTEAGPMWTSRSSSRT